MYAEKPKCSIKFLSLSHSLYASGVMHKLLATAHDCESDLYSIVTFLHRNFGIMSSTNISKNQKKSDSGSFRLLGGLHIC